MGRSLFLAISTNCPLFLAISMARPLFLTISTARPIFLAIPTARTGAAAWNLASPHLLHLNMPAHQCSIFHDSANALGVSQAHSAMLVTET